MSHKVFRLVSSLFLALAVTAIASGPQPVRAAGPWYVAPGGNDSNTCLSPGTACATINGALAKPGFIPGDTIRVAIGTYTGTGDEVVLLDKDATLSGGWNTSFTTQSGMSTIDGQGARRGITVNGGISALVEHLILQNGLATQGGGIRNDGILTISRSSIRNNTAQVRGGILNIGTLILTESDVSGNVATSDEGGITNFGTLTLNSSTLSGNNGGRQGGGLFNIGSATLNNSTVSGNQAEFAGGIYSFTGSLILNNSTISGNTASSGGGIVDDSGTLSSQNSLIAANTASNGTDCWSPSNASGVIISLGHNLVGDTSNCDFTATTGDLTNIAPLLGPLQDNGGPTFTHALLPQSPAIDAGNPTGCTDKDGNLLTTDQRGVARPQGARCDIGAFELEATGGVEEVTIDIKPGNKHNRIMIGSGGNASVQVAILSTPDFNAPQQVNKNSLTFGATGDENSLRRRFLIGTPDCRARDVNHDRLKDLVCSFLIGKTGFKLGDTVGILKGQTVDGTLLEGRDSVVITAPSYPSYPSYP